MPKRQWPTENQSFHPSTLSTPSCVRLLGNPVFNLHKQDERQLDESCHFSQALEQLKEKEYDNIIELCTKALESESDDITIKRLARLLRGLLQLQSTVYYRMVKLLCVVKGYLE